MKQGKKLNEKQKWKGKTQEALREAKNDCKEGFMGEEAKKGQRKKHMTS